MYCRGKNTDVCKNAPLRVTRGAEGNSEGPGTRSYRRLWPGPRLRSHMVPLTADMLGTEEHAAVCPDSAALAEECADVRLVLITTVVRMTAICLFSGTFRSEPRQRSSRGQQDLEELLPPQTPACCAHPGLGFCLTPLRHPPGPVLGLFQSGPQTPASPSAEAHLSSLRGSR